MSAVLFAFSFVLDSKKRMFFKVPEEEDLYLLTQEEQEYKDFTVKQEEQIHFINENVRIKEEKTEEKPLKIEKKIKKEVKFKVNFVFFGNF